MDELISRQAAIDALGEKPLAWTEGEYELGLQNQWQSDVDALNDLPSAQPVQRWIPCTERMPEENERVLICGVKRGIAIARKSTVLGKDTFWVNGTKIMDAVAWMPLPEPWDGEKR